MSLSDWRETPMISAISSTSYERSYQAKHEGSVWLHEEIQELAAQLADEAAMRDAALAGEIEADLTFDLSILGTIRTPARHS
jgi:hypothetical protein